MKPDITSSTSRSVAAKLAATPKEALQKKTVHNAWLINHLENQIRAERCELDRLLTRHSPSPKRERHSSHSPHLTYRLAPSTLSLSAPALIIPPAATSTTTTPAPPAHSPSTPDLQARHKTLVPADSPVAIMHAFDVGASPTLPHPDLPKEAKSSSTSFEMAARGSHWSFAEKERFEIALQKYGPFSWPEIIRTVGTRSEKQVKAYAARYRRRKKLAAASRVISLSVPTSPRHDSQPYSRELFPHLHTHPHTNPDASSEVFPRNPCHSTMLSQRSQACSNDSTAAHSAEASLDNNLSLSHQIQCQTRPTIIGSSPCFSKDLIDLQTSEEPLDPSEKVLESNLLDEAIMKVEQAAVPLGVKLESTQVPNHRHPEHPLPSIGENPSEVDLLFDRALRGELLEDEKPFTTPEVHINVDNSSLDCINNMFMSDRRV